MLAPAVHADRRRQLRALVDGPVLLLGNGPRARNLPMTPVRFRQDSTFLYFTGVSEPDAAMLMVGGRATLFLPQRDDDDALWHGPRPSNEAIGLQLGFDEVRPLAELESALGGLDAKTLAVPDSAKTAWLSRVLNRPLAFGRAHGDDALVDAVIKLRRGKTAVEVAEMRRAAAISTRAHLAVMRATHPGTTERALTALFEGVLAANGATPGYGTILTQRGEVLHMASHEGTLTDGSLLLIDGGGEVDTGYGVDISRTTPVNGRFSGRQRAAYEAVLEAQRVAIDACTINTRYRQVHDTACRVLAQFLQDEGLLRVSPDEALESGAHAIFYPHGTGHHLGMDVHDLENFGDRPSYPPGQGRPHQFGTQNLRMDLPLEDGWIVTVEPGLYIIPEVLNDPSLRASLGDQVDWDAALAWTGLGGIRVEDDILVTAAGPDNLTEAVPKTIDALEQLVGSGAPAHEILG